MPKTKLTKEQLRSRAVELLKEIVSDAGRPNVRPTAKLKRAGENANRVIQLIVRERI